jgi:DNA-binding CsgD family transcriptional regulator
MDVTIQTVLRLHEQGIPRRTIAKRAGISLQKVRKILITAGAWSDETSEKIGKLRANGMSVPEIAEELGVKTNTVWSYLPYSKGMYNQEYPTINAIRVRNSK